MTTIATASELDLADQHTFVRPEDADFGLDIAALGHPPEAVRRVFDTDELTDRIDESSLDHPPMPMTTTTASPADHTPDPHTRDRDLPAWTPARVAWFDAEKGFGFLTPDTGPAVFLDYQVIEVPGYKTLTAGQQVIYTALDTPRGPEATRVVALPAHRHRARPGASGLRSPHRPTPLPRPASRGLNTHPPA